jgi:hypothetical protein
MAAVAVCGTSAAADASSAAAAGCSRAGAPSAARAWRAYLPPFTPVRRRLDAPAEGTAQTYAGAWRLVLGSARSRSGACRLRVRLSRRPNTASGWVSAGRVVLRPTRWRIRVSRARRDVELLHAGRVKARWRAVVGTAGAPTPRGTFAIDAAYRVTPGGTAVAAQASPTRSAARPATAACASTTPRSRGSSAGSAGRGFRERPSRSARSPYASGT